MTTTKSLLKRMNSNDDINVNIFAVIIVNIVGI